MKTPETLEELMALIKLVRENDNTMDADEIEELTEGEATWNGSDYAIEINVLEKCLELK